MTKIHVRAYLSEPHIYFSICFIYNNKCENRMCPNKTCTNTNKFEIRDTFVFLFYSLPPMLSAFFLRTYFVQLAKNTPLAQRSQDLFSHDSFVITAGVYLWRKHVAK